MSIARSPRRSWPAQRVGPALDQRPQRCGRERRASLRFAVEAGQQLDRARDEGLLELSVHLAQHGDTSRIGVRRHAPVGWPAGSRRDSPAMSRNCRQCSLTSATPPRAAARRGRSSPSAQQGIEVVPGPEPLGLSVLGHLGLGEHPADVLVPAGGPPGTQLGQPAAVQLLGEGVDRDHEVHLDTDQRVERQPDLVLVGRAEVGGGEHRDSLVLPHPVADARPAALDLRRESPASRWVRSSSWVASRASLLRGHHLHPGGLERLACAARFAGITGRGACASPMCQISLSSCHVTDRCRQFTTQR